MPANCQLSYRHKIKNEFRDYRDMGGIRRNMTVRCSTLGLAPVEMACSLPLVTSVAHGE